MTTKVTFGVVNCNRLHYMRSCIESLLETTKNYHDKELIVVDNASVEDGTKEYLDSLRQHVYDKRLTRLEVIQQPQRDPSNEFAKGLNKIVELSQGELICPLQGDMQFVVEDWLDDYVELFNASPHVGCITLDAQRAITNKNAKLQEVFSNGKFYFDYSRPSVMGAGDVMYHRSILGRVGRWSVNNQAHEGGSDSETDYLNRVKSMNLGLTCVVPAIPPAIAIYTDARGTNARVRGNKRYGDYWAPKEGHKYYQTYKKHEAEKLVNVFPISIEQLAKSIGWDLPLNSDGQWLKNPIRPETATSKDYVELHQNDVSPSTLIKANDSYLNEWMGE